MTRDSGPLKAVETQDDPIFTSNGGEGVLKSAPGSEIDQHRALADKNLLSSNDGEALQGDDQPAVPDEP